MEPHPHLDAYYRDRDARRGYVDGLFDDCAPHYDWVSGLLSFGSGNAYRRYALRKAGLEPGMAVLDVGTGTGLVAKAAAAVVGDRGTVVGVDPSAGMLGQARRYRGVTLVRGLGEALPIASESFDMVTMGFALRHVADLEAAFREYLRVLKPGGRALILELSRPKSRLGLGLAKLYMRRIVPALVKVGTRSARAREMMRYYWDTIEHCVPPAEILAAMRAAGFADVERVVWFGMSSEYRGRRPAS